MNLKKIGLFCVFVFVFSSFAYAAEPGFRLYLNPIKSSIPLNGEAVYEMSISNQNIYEDRFRIYYSDVLWDFHTDPRTSSTMTLLPKETKKVKLVFKPTDLDYGTYVIPVNVRSLKTDSMQTTSVAVSIMSSEMLQDSFYNTIIRLSGTVQDKIDPRNPLQFSIMVENMNPKINENLTLHIETPLFTEIRELSLSPYEKETVEFSKQLDPLLHPEKHYLSAYVTQDIDGNEIKVGGLTKPLFFEIASYGGLEQDKQEKTGFLSKTEIITISNTGNTKRQDILRFSTNWFKRMFQRTDPSATYVIDEGKKYYSYDISLDPEDSTTITIRTDYSLVFWIVLILALVIIGYYVMRTPLLIAKSYANITLKEGGISELKIMLHLKNRSMKALDNVHVIDKVPYIADIIKDFPVGTMQPTSILKHDKKGTIVKWNIDTLDGFEERILTYNIKSRLSILGGFKLPTAHVKFKQFGRTRTVTSNKVFSKI